MTLEEMTDLYETQGAEYPRSLKEGGAETIEDFCSIILEEAEEEGVRAEVVYVQAMLETGWLQFGGDAVESQFNFSGLGTTGGGVQGNSYPDVRTGIRAQVQHLKAYASTEELSGNCVESRFDMVKRGSAFMWNGWESRKTQMEAAGRQEPDTEKNCESFLRI